ncbi:Na+/H+ antiporter [Alloacidobacterium dinghuense]|uniref:Na+/H+ antiporter n=1 Tax=Alloacidobacterium dinghuense TaxID=2763107 RepID=A0A7G8BG42_9BACT|nr:Na+/H+ antiporter [Alloacidobacterium dinghuense]QNI31512.1 Na+/H+ antiporter [Alloacidobacterium dinghuense]
MSGIGAVEFVFLLLLFFIVVFGVFARKVGTPYPIIMVIGGLLLSFFPAIPDIKLEPDLIFLVVLPPLLYSSAWQTSWRDFRYNIVSISFLAIGLVAFTVVGVALAAPKVFPGFDWRLGLVLGAIVAPTDAIAATSIARRIGLPGRIVDILEGESLVNDATGLLALEFATGILVEQRYPTVAGGLLTLLWLTAGGIAIGLIIAWIVARFERRIDDGPIEVALSILVPYVAYLAAQAAHASGVLAVVSCGLYLSRCSARLFSPTVRLGTWAVWDSLTFILNGLVFVLIGLQFPAVRASIHEYGRGTIFAYGGIFSALLILLRLVWVYPGARLSYIIRTRVRNFKESPPGVRHIFVVGWTGMRGVVSLAAALALPTVLADGSPFPHRDMIVVLTFCVIFATLVLQGLTLPPLIRSLGLAGNAGPDCEELEARRIVTQAAVSHLEGAKARDTKKSAEIYDDLANHYRHRLTSLNADASAKEISDHELHLSLSLEALRVERETAIRLRNEGRINDTVLRRIERELDLNESRLVNTEE